MTYCKRCREYKAIESCPRCKELYCYNCETDQGYVFEGKCDHLRSVVEDPLEGMMECG